MPRKSRLRRGEGTVYQRASDGLWVGMLDLGLAGGKRRRKTVYGQSENEVLQKLNKLRAARDRGLDLLAPSWTVGQWLDAWLTEIKKFDGTRPATLTLYKGLAERYVKPVIGGVRLDKLTRLTSNGWSQRHGQHRPHAGPRQVRPRSSTSTSWSVTPWPTPTGWNSSRGTSLPR
jgi:hypothetical protein